MDTQLVDMIVGVFAGMVVLGMAASLLHMRGR